MRLPRPAPRRAGPGLGGPRQAGRQVPAEAEAEAAMALSRGLRCCRRVFGWVPVLIIALVVLWSYYAYVFELCLVTLTNSVERVAYLTIFHVIFVFFVWTYWKSIFTPPQQPDKKFHMSYADKERYENEEHPEGQREILLEMARKLPVYTRTGNGGQAHRRLW